MLFISTKTIGMSLLGLLKKKKDPLAPAPNQETYDQFVFNMEVHGTNDLVQRNNVDFTFRPPASTPKYTETIFKEQAAGKA